MEQNYKSLREMVAEAWNDLFGMRTTPVDTEQLEQDIGRKVVMSHSLDDRYLQGGRYLTERNKVQLMEEALRAR